MGFVGTAIARPMRNFYHIIGAGLAVHRGRTRTRTSGTARHLPIDHAENRPRPQYTPTQYLRDRRPRPLGPDPHEVEVASDGRLA